MTLTGWLGCLRASEKAVLSSQFSVKPALL
jgi:hypothetical protein